MIIPISSDNNINNLYKITNFKSNQNSQKINYQRRAFIEEKTQNLEDLTLAVTILALLAGSFGKTDIVSAKQKTGKWAIGLTLSALGLLVATCIKKYQLGKNFDKENVK